MHLRPGSSDTPRAMYSSAAIDPTEDIESCRSSRSSTFESARHVLGSAETNTPTPLAAAEVPPQTVSRQVEQAFVGRELLQRADAAGSPDDRDEIPGFDLRVDVLMDRLAHVKRAVEREAEIVHDKRDRACDFVGRGSRGPQRL